MKKKLITAYLLIFLLLPSVLVLAANPIGVGENLDIGAAVYRIADYVWFIFGGVAVIMFIVAGIQFLSAQGEPSKVNSARQSVIWGIVGVGVALLSNSIGALLKNLLGV